MSLSDAFGVYVHWPFCAAKCPYCDFNSHVRHHGVDEAMFLEAYRAEIRYVAQRSPGRMVTSIFFGGGTPSLMNAATVGAILEAISAGWTVAPDAEITMEANPGSVEAGRFRDYRKAGVNRVSIGVQSLDDRQLKMLGRLHSADEARRAVAVARDTFPRVSFDMIYARPDQTAEAWERELGEAFSLCADHLSLYQLTIEQGTPFFELQARGRLQIPDPDRAARLYELTGRLTGEAGLPAYEISNHARPGAGCRHNMLYWRYGEYAGIGPGAHGRLELEHGRTATAARLLPEDWWQAVMVDGHGFDVMEELEPEAAADEMLLMGLRLREGLSVRRYEALAGRSLKPDRLQFLIDEGFVEWGDEHHLRATPAGFLVLDAVIADLAA